MARQPKLMNYSRMKEILGPHHAQIHDNFYFSNELGIVYGDPRIFMLVIGQSQPPFVIDDYRIGVLVSGEICVNINLVERHITPGTIVFLGPGTIISPIRFCGKIEIYGLGLFADFPMPQMPSAFNGQVRDFQIKACESDIATARHIIDTVWHVVHQPDYNRQTVSSLVSAMMHHYDGIYRQHIDLLKASQNEVNMYQVRKRVNEMYFGLLLINEQIVLNKDLQELLAQNEKKLASMVKNGTAAESDYQNVKAERLNVVQQATSLQAQQQALKRMLSAFCGIEVKDPSRPPLFMGGDGAAQDFPLNRGIEGGSRPELKAIDAQLRLADAQEKALDAALMPKLGVFAQGFYGYPGYNMFEDMMRRKFSWNGMVGARLTWNIGALYTRKNDKASLNAQRSTLNIQKETFLFNNNLEQIQQNENIERYKKLMADDEEIISLRSSIRKAAESKLSHGIIDVNDLVKEINNENAARVGQSMHEIQMLKEIYDQKFTAGE